MTIFLIMLRAITTLLMSAIFAPMKVTQSIYICAATAALSLTASAMDFAILDFQFQHGTVITNQYTVSDGITISATGSQNTAIVYDSELGGVNGGSIDGADPDLERLVIPTGGVGPGGPGGDLNAFGWDGGNLGTNANAGGLLIIQENPAAATTPVYGPGVSSASLFDPDDDAGGGTFTFEIDEANFTYNFFQVTLADFEEDGATYVTTLFGVNGGTEVISFADLVAANPGGIPEGNNFISILPELSINGGTEALDRVEIAIAGSGSISNITFSENSIPEPTSTFFVGLSSLLILRRRR